MKLKKIILIIAGLFIVCPGCCYDCYTTKKTTDDLQATNNLETKYYYTANLPNPVVLAHADIEKKKAYLRKAEKTVEQFRAVADDARKRNDNLRIEEIGQEANKYIKMYVEPIIFDHNAIENLETKAEIAKLHLLSAFLYFDLAGYYQSRYYLNRLNGHFGTEYLSTITTEHGDYDFNTLAEGIEDLERAIAIKINS